MISIENLDIASLPSLPLEKRLDLPRTHAIYFVVSATGEILYIGKAVSLFFRWRTHHRLMQFARLGGVRIIWLAVDNPFELPKLEKAALLRFRPLMNRTEIPDEDRCLDLDDNWTPKLRQ